MNLEQTRVLLVSSASDTALSWRAVADPAAGIDRFYVLPEDFYSETYTFFGHSPGGTWHGDDVAVILWIVAHPWIVPLGIFCPLAGWLAVAVRRRQLERRKRAYVRLANA